MEPTILRPDVKYRHKLYIAAIFWGIVALIGIGFIGVLIGSEEGGASGVLTGLIVAVLINLVWIVPILLVIHPYYRSLKYEIHDDEVIVRVGIITRSVKHVPFRTITNLKVHQGPLDRLFGIGNLSIQTAGMSGQSGVEEKLEGLPNFQEVYEQVAVALRRFRGGMSPTQAEEELVQADGQALAQLLEEVRAIRKAVERE